MTKKRANKLKINHQKLSSLNNREGKKSRREKNGTEPHGPMIRQYPKVTFVSDSQKEIRNQCGAKKKFEEILAKNSKLDRKHKLTDSRSSENSKHDKLYEILTQTHQIQTAKNQR